MLSFFIQNKGVVGITASTLWSIAGNIDPNVFPPGENYTITGMLAFAIVVLWKELKAAREETKNERKRTEEKNKKMIKLLESIVESSPDDSKTKDQYRQMSKIFMTDED